MPFETLDQVFDAFGEITVEQACLAAGGSIPGCEFVASVTDPVISFSRSFQRDPRIVEAMNAPLTDPVEELRESGFGQARFPIPRTAPIPGVLDVLQSSVIELNVGEEQALETFRRNRGVGRCMFRPVCGS